mgnify:CR=1 FL=1
MNGQETGFVFCFFVVLVVAIVLSVKTGNNTSSSSEPWIQVPQTAYLDAIQEKPGYKNSQFISRPSFKPRQTPRFFEGDMVGQLKGAMPSSEVSAFGNNPDEFVKMVDETYGANGDKELNKDIENAIGYPGDFQDIALPGIESMSEGFSNFGEDASDPNVFTYNRLVYANQRQRGQQGADFIRGDLKIEPDNRGWFQVSARPSLQLRVGAVEAGLISGEYDQQELAKFRSKVNYGTDQVGVQLNSSLGQGNSGTDVSVNNPAADNRVVISRYA